MLMKDKWIECTCFSFPIRETQIYLLSFLLGNRTRLLSFLLGNRTSLKMLVVIPIGEPDKLMSFLLGNRTRLLSFLLGNRTNCCDYPVEEFFWKICNSLGRRLVMIFQSIRLMNAQMSIKKITVAQRNHVQKH